MINQFWLYMDSPIGWLGIKGSDHFVHAIYFMDQDSAHKPKPTESLMECRLQLEEYFNGERKTFDFPYEMIGTDFQKKVWKKVLEIPFGQIKTYGEIARELGNIKLARAVGLTNGKNRLSIVIPCHRVIGSNNRLIGYGGGLIRKEWLLKHEKRYSGKEQQLDIFLQ